jgi:hypothetical protein
MTEPLILKRAPIGDNQEDYNVLEATALPPLTEHVSTH